ncbi:hypothetical protein M8C21_030135 [Ambrosia artemisiifolia]|uniref:Calmodulin binding protein central domain-containing protein n=1 Tax=Ambrosia artemisiifolia TaxID=4212 RepID=A0AAD5GNN0_AMBAR|nr:hypothetical protein M8C21_030135 [Ambrosia artemisiifolia]
MTVKDFLDRLSSNPIALQKIYGSNGKRWEDTIRHAKRAISSKKCNIRGSVGSNTKEQDDVSMVDHNFCNRLDVESFEASACASSDDMMPMVFDQFSLDQNFEYYQDEVFYSDLFTTLEQL